ncbi:MAG: Chaperone protein DnaJ [Chroococcopsis gigantea SAG 12.99]|jgi:curved DNA-binding protein CbpA|nr:DnaJ domain-containing protein [Chlorogloea purpurea SAG 13.99]MDV3000228.1 Chaperone protein DnaJ [Chroococcopsis gigantea SAG 12.99]
MILSIRQGLFQFDLVDHYAILGVSVNAEIAEIRQRYLKIAYKIHPDTCKAKSKPEQEQAGQMLSKMVNPAYETLSREQSKTEFRLIIGQIGRGVSQDLSKITIASESAKKLSQSTANIDLAYQKLLQALSVDQYNNFDTVIEKIAQLSELNLMYLMLTEEENLKKTNRPYIGQQAQGNSPVKTTSGNEPKSTDASPKSKEAPIVVYIRRAQEHLDKEQPAQAVRELRDALREEPENSVCHALLGLAYLRQNQTSMAKVHINRAWQTDRKNPIVINCKKELDKVVKPTIEMGDEDDRDRANTDKPGGFWSRFGGKKK